MARKKGTPKHFTMVEDIELCSVSAGKINGESRLILTARLDQESFQSSNLGLKPEQAVRLWRDLCNLFAHSDLMKEAVANNPDLYSNYERIVLDQSPPQPEKPKRTRRKKQ